MAAKLQHFLKINKKIFVFFSILPLKTAKFAFIQR